MAANRKLLSEIQQVLKKYEEGVLLFDDIWDKVYAAGQQSLKEKYESDLKKEIKKLQRLRDQIKTWIGSAEVKDKAQLIEARKVIETKMEQFKICEKDTKTKAYSKEGLARDSKVDPKEAMREEKRNWINDCLERLNDIINSVDADKEKLLSAKGNKAKNKEQIEKFDNRIQKNKWHINKLESIIKLLDNEDLDPSALDSLKESLEYYLETAVEDDGAVGVEDEFDIYEDLNLDALLSSAIVAIPAAFELSPRSSTAATATGDTTTGASSLEPSASASSAVADAASATVSDKSVSNGSDGADIAPAPAAPALAKKGSTITSIIGGIGIGAGKTPVIAAPAPPAGPAKPSAVASSAVAQKDKAVPVPAPALGNAKSGSGPVAASKQPVAKSLSTSAPAALAQEQPTRTASGPTSASVANNANVSQPASTGSAAVTPSPQKTAAPAPTPAPSNSTNPVAIPAASAAAATPAAATNRGETAVQDVASDSTHPAVPTAAPVPAAAPLSWAHAAAPPPSTASVAAPKTISTPSPSPSPLLTSLSSATAVLPPSLPLQAAATVTKAAQLPPSQGAAPSLPLGRGLGRAGVVVGGPTAASVNSTLGISIGAPGGGSGLGPISAPSSNLATLNEPISSSTPSLPSAGQPQAFTNSIIGPSSSAHSSHSQKLNAAPAAMNAELASTLNMLRCSMTYLPDGPEVEKPVGGYTPRNFYSHSPASYPSAPLLSSHAESALLFERMPMDALFFVFYFQQGTYQQCLAAKQLKKHSWRFHKKYMTWFQRHEEPKIATDEYEEGTYVYFDYESGWCQRIKSEFKFEYLYLEDELSTGAGDS